MNNMIEIIKIEVNKPNKPMCSLQWKLLKPGNSDRHTQGTYILYFIFAK